jgi:hypothetical protein
VRSVDRYVEQLWDTVFAKADEMMLFNWDALTQDVHPGNRAAWENLHTSFDYQQILQSYRSHTPPGAPSEPTMAHVAGSALEKADQFLGKLGKPIGVASYRPYHAWGEDFLHNYFGMIGIPIDLYPTFPVDAKVVLLTEAAAFDPEIVARIKGQLMAGKTVIITSGLLHALQGKGIEDIAELQYTDRKILATQYLSGFGPGSGSALGDEQNPGILFPDIRFLTNDSWPIVRALSHGRGYPLMLLNRYSQGILYVWTMPDNFNDLYRLPVSVTRTIKDYVMAGFPVRLDGPSQVALFAYDNNTCIVENYLSSEVDVKVSLRGEFNKLHDLVTGDILNGQPPEEIPRGRHGFRAPVSEWGESFNVHLLPHSYSAFAAEK